ncbi:ABC transporter permease [Actinomadura bangladeshensis]|uniref:ABC transporter permease n=1 Tax=Actinomadura bangladeshensis TaxID=453573 RepID=UPI0014050244|nr:ABC transporter permease [Actinomadura bangladeshensis]
MAVTAEPREATGATSTGAEGPRRSTGGRGGDRLADLVSRFALVAVLLLLWSAFSVYNPQVFNTTSNLQTVLSVQATTGLLALAVVVPLVAGQFDLSTGFQLGLAQSLCAVLVIKEQWPPLLALLVVLVVGVVIGVVNGQLITRLGLPSFTTTLGTGMLVLGLTQWLTENKVITGTAAPWFFDLGRIRVAGVPLPFIYLAVVAAILFVLLDRTVWGRRAYAVGANPAAARLSGIAADRQVRHSFVIAGFLCSLAGCISMMSLGGSSPVIGLGSLLPAFAAAFLGATCFRPGRYNVVGTVVAVYVIGVGITGLQQLGAQAYIQDVFNGAALLIALVISTIARRRRVVG